MLPDNHQQLHYALTEFYIYQDKILAQNYLVNNSLTHFFSFIPIGNRTGHKKHLLTAL